MHAHGAGFAQLNSHNTRRRVRPEEQRVFLKFHCYPQIAQIFADSKENHFTGAGASASRS
jgi:hypothetical protein